MFKITIPKPLYVSGNKLTNDLLSMLAPAGATVEYIPEDNTPPIPLAEQADASNTGNGAAPAVEVKRRGRPPKEAATPAPAGQQTPPQAESAPTGGDAAVTQVLNKAQLDAAKANLVGGLDRGALLEEFTKLVDADYDKALNVLTEFQVQRFSDLKDEQLPAFAQAMR